jgi:cytochrome P450
MSYMTIPRATARLPLIGHVLPFLRNPLEFLASLPDQGDLVEVRLGSVSMVVVCDPVLTRQVLNDDRTFDKGGPGIASGRELFGDGLAVCPHSRHRRQRRLVQPAFHPARFSAYAEVMTAESLRLVDDWPDGGFIDVEADMLRLAIRILTKTLFSGDRPDVGQEEIVGDLTVILKSVYWRVIIPQFLQALPTPGNRRYRLARTRVRAMLEALLASHRKSGADQGDLLSALLAAKDDGGGLSDVEIYDQLVTFFVAGTETTAKALAWALHFVSQDAEIESDLFTEVDTVLEGRPARLEDIPRLQLTGWIVNEALRLRPPLWMSTRVTTQEVTLGKHRLRAGTNILFSPYLIHHLDEAYENPEHFNPYRWKDAGTTLRPVFLAFGGGARKCIGDRFSMAEAVIALANIAACRRLIAEPGRDVRPALAAVIGPGDLRLRVSHRVAPGIRPDPVR